MDDERLIDEVYKRKGIYDKSDMRHCNKEYLTNAWSEIADALNSNVDEVKKKWTNYRDYFRRQLKLQMGDKGRRKKWIFFDRMSFLVPYMRFWGPNGTPDMSLADNSDLNLNLDCVSVDSESHLEEDPNPDQQALHDREMAYLNLSAASGSSSVRAGSPVGMTSSDKRSAKFARSMKRKYEDEDEGYDHLRSLPDHENDYFDEDDHFFKSCLPTLKTFTPEEKLEFRIGVQQLLLKFIRKEQNDPVPRNVSDGSRFHNSQTVPADSPDGRDQKHSVVNQCDE